MKKLIYFICLALIGCSSQLELTHPTATSQQAELDYAACRYDIDMKTATMSLGSSMAYGPQLFNSCMAAKGYSLQKRK